MTYKFLDDHDMPKEESHFWCDQERYTYCGLSVRDKMLSPAPSCVTCQRAILENERLLADLQDVSPDHQAFLMQMEAAALAPYLQKAVDHLRQRTRSWESLSADERLCWAQRASVFLSICLNEHRGAPDYLQVAADEARKLFQVFRGNKA